MTHRYIPAVQLLGRWYEAAARERGSPWEAHMTSHNRITFDPLIMNGRACVRGLRMPVATVLRCVASDMTRAEILAAYPNLEDADISACLEYAAGLADNRFYPAA